MFKGIGSFSTGLLLITVTVGCGRGLSQFSNRQKHGAPKSQAEAGVIVRGASETALAEVLDRHPAARFRVLNSQHQMYEITGVSAAELKAGLPQVAMSRNHYFTTVHPNSHQTIRALMEQAPPDKLQKCVEAENGPKAVMTAETFSSELAEKMVPRHGVLRVNGQKSVNSPKATKPLRMAFVIMRPKGALEEEEELLPLPAIELKTDAMGGYGIGLIVQDENNVCDLDIVEFAVTDNVTYQGPNTKPVPNIDLSKLRHLASLHAQDAWTKSQGEGQVVAIIDTGVNYNHSLLRDNVLVNRKEIAGNGIDDDGNGFVDDVTGWDFANSDSMAYDDAGHGSHVAGLAASSVMGMAKKAKILPVKVLGAFGGDTGAVAAGIRYAVDQGARVLNMSLGSYQGPDPEIVAAIDYAESKGALIVTAAGNGHPMTGLGLDTDETPNYPSSLENENILSVAAIGANDELTMYSNFGLKSVDVAAPGGDDEQLMVSTFMENPAGIAFVEMAGTSMASPIVAGIAAQVWSQNPSLKSGDVKKALMKTGPVIPGLAKQVVSGRKVDALQAVLITNALVVTQFQ